MRKNDRKLVLLILIAALAAFGILKIYQQKTTKCGEAVVYIAGEEQGRYPLDQELEKKIVQNDGSYNLLVIKEGKAYVTDASCPDQICVHHQGISKRNESIVCLPNQLVVKIENASEESDVDLSTH